MRNITVREKQEVAAKKARDATLNNMIMDYESKITDRGILLIIVGGIALLSLLANIMMTMEIGLNKF